MKRVDLDLLALLNLVEAYCLADEDIDSSADERAAHYRDLREKAQDIRWKLSRKTILRSPEK
jgi:hypothetical protein